MRWKKGSGEVKNGEGKNKHKEKRSKKEKEMEEEEGKGMEEVEKKDRGSRRKVDRIKEKQKKK